MRLSKLVGQGYNDFWNCKLRYRVCKGSRASKKSKTTALNFIYRIMKYPESNLLVVRNTFSTLLDSCYSDLIWAINRYGVADYWQAKKAPLELAYLPTGQRILFRGLDDPLKITSISVPFGYLCWAWIEEAYEIKDEASVDMIDESIRGEIPPHLFKQITLTFNPWNEHHWLKRKFFDKPDKDTFTKTTNYKCNEWLDDADREIFEKMRVRNPRRYKVAGLGDWGVTSGLIYENWREYKDENPKGIPIFGLDFGYKNPTAFVAGYIDQDKKQIWIENEVYKEGLSNKQRAQILREYKRCLIIADSASPENIAELRDSFGFKRLKACHKGKDSVINGIAFLQDYEIIVHDSCVNMFNELSSYRWDTDKYGNEIEKPVKEKDHLMDALRYAIEPFIIKKSWLY